MDKLILAYNTWEVPQETIESTKFRIKIHCKRKSLDFLEYKNCSKNLKPGTLYWVFENSKEDGAINIERFFENIKMTNFYYTRYLNNFGVESTIRCLKEKYLVFLTKFPLKKDRSFETWTIQQEYKDTNKTGKIALLTIPEDTELSTLIEGFIADLFSD